ncbi:hypothetical protein AB4144_22320 [Rhizobiaceae sp. 2RAB30]
MIATAVLGSRLGADGAAMQSPMVTRSDGAGLEQFQQKCAAVLRPELRKNKELEHFRDSEKSGIALTGRSSVPKTTQFVFAASGGGTSDFCLQAFSHTS